MKSKVLVLTANQFIICLLFRRGHSVVHKYSHPGTFAVTAVCSSTDIHITARKIIAIQEPIEMFGVIKCYAGKLSFHETNCKALYGEDLKIQIGVNAGRMITIIYDNCSGPI